MHIRMVSIGDLAAIRAMIAAINRDPAFAAHGFLAVQSLGQRLGNRFELAQLMPRKKIGMPQPPAFERALQQTDPLRLVWKIFKCHHQNLTTDGTDDTDKNFVCCPPFRSSIHRKCDLNGARLCEPQHV